MKLERLFIWLSDDEDEGRRQYRLFGRTAAFRDL